MPRATSGSIARRHSGIAKLEDKPDPRSRGRIPPQARYLKAADAGDSVRFERPGPFGTYRWERKKTRTERGGAGRLRIATAPLARE